MTRVLAALLLLASPVEGVISFRWNQSAFAQENEGVQTDFLRPKSQWIRAVDGDTITLNGERIRIRSEAGPIDAPELRKAKCPLELFRAQAARERLSKLLQADGLISGDALTIDRRGTDRYGRTVAVVYADGRDVGAILVREGHARPWPKLSKADRPTWCGG